MPMKTMKSMKSMKGMKAATKKEIFKKPMMVTKEELKAFQKAKKRSDDEAKKEEKKKIEEPIIFKIPVVGADYIIARMTRAELHLHNFCEKGLSFKMNGVTMTLLNTKGFVGWKSDMPKSKIQELKEMSLEKKVVALDDPKGEDLHLKVMDRVKEDVDKKLMKEMKDREANEKEVSKWKVDMVEWQKEQEDYWNMVVEVPLMVNGVKQILLESTWDRSERGICPNLLMKLNGQDSELRMLQDEEGNVVPMWVQIKPTGSIHPLVYSFGMAWWSSDGW